MLKLCTSFCKTTLLCLLFGSCYFTPFPVPPPKKKNKFTPMRNAVPFFTFYPLHDHGVQKKVCKDVKDSPLHCIPLLVGPSWRLKNKYVLSIAVSDKIRVSECWVFIPSLQVYFHYSFTQTCLWFQKSVWNEVQKTKSSKSVWKNALRKIPLGSSKHRDTISVSRRFSALVSWT